MTVKMFDETLAKRLSALLPKGTVGKSRKKS